MKSLKTFSTKRLQKKESKNTKNPINLLEWPVRAKKRPKNTKTAMNDAGSCAKI